MNLRALRDRAIVLAGFVAGARRRNLSELDLDDVEIVAKGMLMTLWREKNRPYGARRVDVRRESGPCDPVAAMEAWLDAYSLALRRSLRPDDPLFPRIDRHGKIVFAGEQRAAKSGSNHGYGPALHSGEVPWRLSRQAINEIVKRLAGDAGIVGATSHGLRRGLANTLHQKGASREKIAKAGGWKRLDSVNAYIDDIAFAAGTEMGLGGFRVD